MFAILNIKRLFKKKCICIYDIFKLFEEKEPYITVFDQTSKNKVRHYLKIEKHRN